MKNYFLVSLCRNGILGGGMTVDEQGVCYHTNKLTVPDKYRRLELPYAEMTAVGTERVLGLPAVTFVMADGEKYRFVVFTRRKLLALLGQNCARLADPT